MWWGMEGYIKFWKPHSLKCQEVSDAPKSCEERSHSCVHLASSKGTLALKRLMYAEVLLQQPGVTRSSDCWAPTGTKNVNKWLEGVSNSCVYCWHAHRHLELVCFHQTQLESNSIVPLLVKDGHHFSFLCFSSCGVWGWIKMSPVFISHTACCFWTQALFFD